MNPTAEDILNRRSREAGYLDFDHLDSSVSTSLRTAFVITSMEEYSLLKSKEAADKAWEAAWNRFRQEEYGRVPPTLPDKETFMKELFKDHG